MGTRGTLGIRKNKKDFLMYNHYDSYPESLGQEVVDFVKGVKDFDGLAVKTAKLKAVDGDKKIPLKWEKKYRKFHQEVSSGDDWYSFLRDLQGVDFFKALLKDEIEHIILGNDFIKDSLFCEYGYIINLDTNKLEFWVGFQDKPQKGNRYGVKPESGSDNEYYPCKKVGECPLDKIPEDWQSKFFPKEEE